MEGSVQEGRNAEKWQAFQRSRRTGECFDNKEIASDLGKLWPFGMEGSEVALERGQKKAEPQEMGMWGHKNRGGRMFALGQEWIMNEQGHP